MSDLTSAFSGYFKGRKVLVTGHTGFKGSWLTLWLLELGAEVTGFALDPAEKGGLYDSLGLTRRIRDIRGDVRDAAALKKALAESRAEVVFHLAAQPLVVLSYEKPVDTFEINGQGTLNLLEALRGQKGVKTCVCITTDKVYENREWVHPYRENDSLGGKDPYSASKAVAEIIIASYRHSFFNPAQIAEHGLSLSSVRAGNVIGGGDFAKDRILPDCVRALHKGEPIPVRNPSSQRPWQHVLEPLSGYLYLASLQGVDPAGQAQSYNFGPYSIDAWPVGKVVERAIQAWGSGSWKSPGTTGPHEAKFLQLDIAKAQTVLGWRPIWDCGTAIDETIRWYKAWSAGASFDAGKMTVAQVQGYCDLAEKMGLPWSPGKRP